MRYVGIDIGSLWTKAVMIEDGRKQAHYIMPTGLKPIEAGEQAIEHLLAKASVSLSDIDKIVATGYGRVTAPWATKTVTEITCQAKGVFHLIPSTRMLIDIGGQDTKVIKLDSSGRVLDFRLNDKCAAGTGRFIEVMANAVKVKLSQLSELSQQATRIAPISSNCTIFAESEIISLVAQGESIPNIIAGVFNSIAQRAALIVSALGLEQDCIVTGGIAKNPGMVAALEKSIGVKLLTPPEPRITAALGAALIAKSL